jgi:hypothetical protein
MEIIPFTIASKKKISNLLLLSRSSVIVFIVPATQDLTKAHHIRTQIHKTLFLQKSFEKTTPQKRENTKSIMIGFCYSFKMHNHYKMQVLKLTP